MRSIPRYPSIAIAGALWALVAGTGCRAPRDPTEPILTVLVSRHSIRSVTETTPPVEVYSTRPEGFPRWPPPADTPGNLTPRGRERAVRLGRYYRDRYVAEGLLPQRSDCPDPGRVYFRSDLDQRTRETSAALIEGLSQGATVGDCGIVNHVNPSPVASHESGKREDPLFHPQDAGLCRLDLGAAEREIRAAVGDGLERFADRAAAELDALQEITRCCQPAACAVGKDPPPARCTLRDIPARLQIDEAKGTISFKSPISVGNYLSQTFQMEYAEGMRVGECPGEAGAPCVGWGLVDENKLYSLMRLRTLHYAVTERTPTIARTHGSNLMLQIGRTLEQGVTGAAVAGALPPAGARFVAFVGHDGNLTDLGAMLGVHWKLDGYQLDDPSITAALVFELRRVRRTGQPVVRLYYLGQSLAQQRENQELSLRNPPRIQRLLVPGCGDGDCAFERFQSILKSAIDLRCTSTP